MVAALAQGRDVDMLLLLLDTGVSTLPYFATFCEYAEEDYTHTWVQHLRLCACNGRLGHIE